MRTRMETETSRTTGKVEAEEEGAPYGQSKADDDF